MKKHNKVMAISLASAVVAGGIGETILTEVAHQKTEQHDQNLQTEAYNKLEILSKRVAALAIASHNQNPHSVSNYDQALHIDVTSGKTDYTITYERGNSDAIKQNNPNGPAKPSSYTHQFIGEIRISADDNDPNDAGNQEFGRSYGSASLGAPVAGDTTVLTGSATIPRSLDDLNHATEFSGDPNYMQIWGLLDPHGNAAGAGKVVSDNFSTNPTTNLERVNLAADEFKVLLDAASSGVDLASAGGDRI